MLYVLFWISFLNLMVSWYWNSAKPFVLPSAAGSENGHAENTENGHAESTENGHAGNTENGHAEDVQAWCWAIEMKRHVKCGLNIHVLMMRFYIYSFYVSLTNVTVLHNIEKFC